MEDLGASAIAGSESRGQLRVIIALTALCGWYFYLAVKILTAPPVLVYATTDWMISYSGGFVRRGLAGSILLGVCMLTKADPWLVVRGFQAGLSAGYLLFLFTLVYRRLSTLGWSGVLLVLTNPVLLFFALQPASQDILFIGPTLWHLRLSEREGYAERAATLFATVGTATALTHEAFLFLCLPINAIVAYRKLGWKGLALFRLPIAACVASMVFHGTAAQAGADYVRVGQGLIRFSRRSLRSRAQALA